MVDNYEDINWTDVSSANDPPVGRFSFELAEDISWTRRDSGVPVLHAHLILEGEDDSGKDVTGRHVFYHQAMDKQYPFMLSAVKDFAAALGMKSPADLYPTETEDDKFVGTTADTAGLGGNVKITRRVGQDKATLEERVYFNYRFNRTKS